MQGLSQKPKALSFSSPPKTLTYWSCLDAFVNDSSDIFRKEALAITVSKWAWSDNEKSGMDVRCGLRQINLVKFSIPLKARRPIFITPLPIVMDVRELSFPKAL